MNRWIFIHEGNPVFIEESEVKCSCFFRDHVMGRLECRRVELPHSESIDRLREIRCVKSERVAARSWRKTHDPTVESYLNGMDLREIGECNDEIVRLSKLLPIDPLPHEIAREAWAVRKERNE